GKLDKIVYRLFRQCFGPATPLGRIMMCISWVKNVLLVLPSAAV
ncbi:MAG: hypothetical protein ACJASY_003049, partial [Halioglobus sp.]